MHGWPQSYSLDISEGAGILGQAEEGGMHHVGREIGLVLPWVTIGTKVSENVW